MGKDDNEGEGTEEEIVVIDETSIENCRSARDFLPKEIDETSIESQSATFFEPKTSKEKLEIKTFGDLSKLFIVISFMLIGVTIVLGLVDKEFANTTLALLWDKIAAVYLVIFGSLLGKR